MREERIPKKFSSMLSFHGQFSRIPPIPQAKGIFGYVIISNEGDGKPFNGVRRLPWTSLEIFVKINCWSVVIRFAETLLIG
ncbi:MAG: hypothetical protein RLZZ519_1442 [Bacteroidota bacterium]|jgi:hypothetical protein